MPAAPALRSRYAVLLSREIDGPVFFRTIQGTVRPLSGTDPDPKESARWKAARSKHIEQAMKDRQSRTVHVATKEGEHVITHVGNRVHATDPLGKSETSFHDHDRAARSAVAEKAAKVEHDAHAKGDTPHTQSAVAIDEETAAAVKHGKLTVPTEGGEIDPDLADAYKRHAAKLGFEVGEWEHDQKAGTATATLAKKGGEAGAKVATEALAKAPEPKSKAGKESAGAEGGKPEAKAAPTQAPAKAAARPKVGDPVVYTHEGKSGWGNVVGHNTAINHFVVQTPGDGPRVGVPASAVRHRDSLGESFAPGQKVAIPGYAEKEGVVQSWDAAKGKGLLVTRGRQMEFDKAAVAPATPAKAPEAKSKAGAESATTPRTYVAPPEVKAVQGVRRAIETSGNAAHIEAETANGTRVRVQAMNFGRVTPDGTEAVTPDGSTFPLSSIRRLHVDGKVAWEHPLAKGAAPVGELGDREVNRRAARVNQLRKQGVPTGEAVKRAGDEARAKGANLSRAAAVPVLLSRFGRGVLAGAAHPASRVSIPS